MTKRVAVVLLASIAGLGETGEVRSVTFGYAKNFLLPRKLAILATPEAVREAEHSAAARSREAQRRHEADAGLRRRLADTRLVVPVRVNEKGAPFGAVGVAEIRERLAAAGISVPESAILLKTKLDTVGEHRVPVKTATDQAEIIVVVEPQNSR